MAMSCHSDSISGILTHWTSAEPAVGTCLLTLHHSDLTPRLSASRHPVLSSLSCTDRADLTRVPAVLTCQVDQLVFVGLPERRLIFVPEIERYLLLNPLLGQGRRRRDPLSRDGPGQRGQRARGSEWSEGEKRTRGIGGVKRGGSIRRGSSTPG